MCFDFTVAVMFPSCTYIAVALLAPFCFSFDAVLIPGTVVTTVVQITDYRQGG